MRPAEQLALRKILSALFEDTCEQIVVKLVAEGYSNKGISAILNLSVKTTEAHRAAAMRKLDVNSTAGLVRYAVRAKLVDA